MTYDPDAYMKGTAPEPGKSHRQRINEVLATAAGAKLCDVVVIGLKPNGGGVYVDWSSNTVSSLNMMLDAGKAKAVQAYIDAAEGKA